MQESGPDFNVLARNGITDPGTFQHDTSNMIISMTNCFLEFLQNLQSGKKRSQPITTTLGSKSSLTCDVSFTTDDDSNFIFQNFMIF